MSFPPDEWRGSEFKLLPSSTRVRVIGRLAQVGAEVSLRARDGGHKAGRDGGGPAMTLLAAGPDVGLATDSIVE